MKKILSVFTVLAALAAAAPGFAKEETLIIFQERHVTIAVPDGYTYASSRDDNGILSVKVTDPRQKIDLSVTFLPDPRNRVATEDGQMSFVAEMGKEYAEGSVEKGYDFKPLAPRTGSGTYCVFTDAKLVKKMPFPPGEFLNVTCGVKAWPGGFLVFTLLSNDTTSKEYETGFKLVKESFEEKAPAGKTM